MQIGGQRILLDCGLFQGFKVLRERNWAPPRPSCCGADAVVLSHAHLDHSGWLPALVKHGFRGPVYASAATRDLAEVLLLDSAHLQEEDARRANRYGYSRHAKALPLYTRRDAQRAIARIVPLRPGPRRAVRPGAHRLHAGGPPARRLRGDAQHCGSERLVFSGDVGRSNDLLMPAPQTGAASRRAAGRVDLRQPRATRRTTRRRSWRRSSSATVQRGGSVLLPAFAVGRAQALMLVLQRLKAQRRDPGRPADLPGQPDGACRPPRCTASTAGCCACRRARSST